MPRKNQNEIWAGIFFQSVFWTGQERRLVENESSSLWFPTVSYRLFSTKYPLNSWINFFKGHVGCGRYNPVQVEYMVWYWNFWRSRNRFADTCAGFLWGSGWDWAGGKHSADLHWCQQEALGSFRPALLQSVWFPPSRLYILSFAALCPTGHWICCGGDSQWSLNLFKEWWGWERAVPGVTVCQGQQLGALIILICHDSQVFLLQGSHPGWAVP